MKLLGNTKNKITKDKASSCSSSWNYWRHCNIVNNNYQQGSRVLYTLVPNKPFGSLLEIFSTNDIFLKPFKLDYYEIILIIIIIIITIIIIKYNNNKIIIIMTM